MYAEKPYCEGELILCQEPLALGPPCTVLKRICVACLSPTKNSTTCYQCEWPLCDVACSKLQHHQAECDMFRNLLAKYATSDERNALHRYEGILPLRILLLKDDDPIKWKKIIGMKLPKFLDSYSSKKSIVRYIRTVCKLTRFDEDLIYDICEIIDKHGIVFNAGTQHIVCLYENVSNITHRCTPNAVYTIVPEKDYSIFIRAAVDIGQGEQIYLSKVNPLYPTILRKRTLMYDKFIICECKRCNDHTENNTHMSSVKCPRCTLGYKTSIDPKDFEAKWRCGKCKRTFKFRKIVNICNAVIRDIGTVEKQDNFKAYHNKFKEIIAKNKSKLHQTHGLMVYMKTYGLLTQYNNEFAIPPTISDKCIKDDLDVAKSMLKVLDIATPGQTAQRCGMTYVIYKLLFTLTVNLRRKKEITKKQYNKDMKSALNYGRLASEMSSVMFNYEAEDQDAETASDI